MGQRDREATSTFKSYIEDCINKQRLTLSNNILKFHQDNAIPHVAQSVITFLEMQELTIMHHPPYLPDLAPSDFWLFNYIKTRVTDHTSAQSLMNEITKICLSIPKEELKKTFDRWVERMEMCVKFGGDYFEHKSQKNISLFHFYI